MKAITESRSFWRARLRTKEFVPVKVKERLLFGGDQRLLKGVGISTFIANRACGVIGAANVLAYQKAEGITYTLSDYHKKALALLSAIRPTLAGVPTIGYLKWGLKRYAATKGLRLVSSSLSSFFVPYVNRERYVGFIRRSLERNRPVLMVTWASTRVPILRNHWVTITEIASRDGEVVLTVSSWGEAYEVNLWDWLDQYSVYKGVLTFEYQSM